MADATLDDVRIEIDASAESAKESIDNLIENLETLKAITEKIDTKKLESVRDTFRGLTTIGDGLKKSGDGMRNISSAIRSMSSVDPSKLKDVAEAVSKIGTSLGNLGSNNKISIRIDSDAIRESIQPLEQSVTTTAQAAQSAMSGAAQAADQLATEEERAGKSGNTAATGLQALINKINEYKAAISGMENGKIVFDSSAYSEAVNGLEQAQEQFSQFKETVKNTPQTMNDVAKSISSIGTAAQSSGLHTFSGMIQGIASVLPMIGTGGMEASAGFQSMAAGLQAVQAAIPIIGIILTAISALASAAKKVGDAMQKAFDRAANVAKSFANSIKQAFLAVISKFEALKKKVKESFGIQDKSMQNFAKKFKSLARLGTFMLLRKAFTYLFKYIGEGFNNLALYSDKFSTEFNKNVSVLYSDLKWLGNAFATAFEPILNHITPILDALAVKIANVCNALAQLFAVLTGKSTWTRAKKLQEDYAKGIEKTKKSVMGLASGIDELHNLHEHTDSGSDTTDPGDMFETLPVDDQFKEWAKKLKDAWDKGDFTDIGKTLGDKLAKALASIDWEKIKQVARKLGSSLATLINGFIMGSFDGKSVSWWIGHTLAEALNTAFEFLREFARKLNWRGVGKAICDLFIGAFDSIDWKVIKQSLMLWAKGISDMLNEIFGNKALWSKAGNFISKGINSVLMALHIFVRNFDASKFGEAMGIFFTNALVKINFPRIGELFSIGVSKIFEALYSFVETFDFDTLADKISGMINNAFDLDWGSVRQSFGTACSKFGSFISRMLVGEGGHGGIDWGKIGQDIMAALVTVIEGIGNFFVELDAAEIGTKIGEFINGAFAYLRDNKDAVIKAVNNVIETLSIIFSTAMAEIDFKSIFGTIGEIVANINWGELFSTAFEAIAAAWSFEKIFKVDVISGIGASIVHWIAEGLVGSIGESFAECGLQIINGLKDGIEANVPSLQELMSNGFAGKIIGWFKEKLSINSPSKEFDSFGRFTVQGYQNGINSMVSSLSSVISGLGTKIQNWFKAKLNASTLISTGKNVVQGFINGLTSVYSSLQSAVGNMANTVSSTFKSILKIHSPSKLFYSFGTFTVQGFNNAIADMSESTKNVVGEWSQSFGNMKASVGFSVDYSGFDSYKLNDDSSFVASATREIQSNIDTSSNQGDSFDYDTMGYVYKEALRDIMTQIVVPAIEGTKGRGDDYGSSDRLGLLKKIQEQAAIYSKSTGLDPFPA
jgi:phage-related protein